LQIISKPEVYLLTTKKSLYPRLVLMYHEKYPELDNFLGFVEEDLDVEMVDE
jgi:hypothetical protein